MDPLSEVEWSRKEVEKLRKEIEKLRKVRAVGEGHWRLINPDNESCFFTDICVMGGSAITVWGDFNGPAITFAHRKSSMPQGLVYWIGSENDISLHSYAMEKAQSGTRCIHALEKYIAPVAIHQIKEHSDKVLGAIYEEAGIHNNSWHFVEDAAKEAIDHLESIGEIGTDYHSDMVHDIVFTYETEVRNQDVEVFDNKIGIVPSRAFIFAVLAIKKLSTLI